MLFFSTSDRSQRVTLWDAVFKGIALNQGLFFPEVLTPLRKSVIKNFHNLSFADISYEVASSLLTDSLPKNILENIIVESMNFEPKVLHLHDNIFTLELFHGPTFAFKDFGARFMASIVAYFHEGANKDLTILVATSGDTGGAVGKSFHNKKGIKVVILYPSKKISEIQEKQLTTLGDNVSAIEINGTFDDCQSLVKKAFSDDTLREKISITSANSINIARLIPQTFYYFTYPYLKEYTDIIKDKKIIFSVPSGNFGNLTAGIIAKKIGLKIDKFIASTNVNDTIPRYLSNGKYEPKTSIQTISNAMDVGNPNNFPRLLELYDQDFGKMCAEIEGASFTDSQTKESMKMLYDKTGYVVDPHGAVGYRALVDRSKLNPSSIHDEAHFFLHTAHPAKFPGPVIDTLGKQALKIPPELMETLNLEKKSIPMENDYVQLCDFLIDNSN